MTNFWCNFLPIIVGIGSALLGGLIGWYLRRSRIKDLEDVVDEKNADYAHLKNAHEMLDIRHNNLQREHSILSVSHNSLSEKTTNLEQEYDSIHEQKTILEKDLASLSASFSTTGEKTGILEQDYKALVASHKNLEERIEVLQEDVAAIENAKAIVTKHFVNYRTIAESRFEELEKASQEWGQKYTFLQSRYDSQNSELLELEKMEEVANSLKIEKERNSQRIADLQEEKEEWESSYRKIFSENKTNLNRLAEMQSLLAEKENSVQSVNSQHEIHALQFAELKVQLEEKESRYAALVNQHGANFTRITEMQALIEQKENDNISLLSKMASTEQQLKVLEETNQKWALSFQQLESEYSLTQSHIATLQQSIVPTEASNKEQIDANARILSYEKELIATQDAKAQLEITRIKLENELDILRGSHSEISAEYEKLVELEKANHNRFSQFEQRIAELESERERYNMVQIPAENSHIEEPAEEEVTVIASTPVQADDLKVVEGIGPKIEAVLHEAGILTFEQLAKTDPDHINAILDAAGPRYRIHNPATWPTQAELAANNDWEKLKELKDQLMGGRASS